MKKLVLMARPSKAGRAELVTDAEARIDGAHK